MTAVQGRNEAAEVIRELLHGLDDALAAERRATVERLPEAIHDWLCDGPHTTKRPSFGWDCERGARRTADILMDEVADWSPLRAFLDEKADR